MAALNVGTADAPSWSGMIVATTISALPGRPAVQISAPLSVTNLGFSLHAATAEVSNTRLSQSNH
jgi:hypothetical protein